MAETILVGKFKDATDPTTGDPTRVLVTQRYAGKGRIRWTSREVTNAQGPSMPVAVQEPYVSVPFGAPAFTVGDEVQVAASPDPLLVGRAFRVAGRAAAGAVTAHRYPLEDGS